LLLDGCRTGEAKTTHAGDLAARIVVHTVAPSWRGGDYGEAKALQAVYRAVLAHAAAHACRSVALPAIGIGGAGCPLQTAADAALTAVDAALEGPVGETVTHAQFWLSNRAHGAFDGVMLSRVPPMRAARRSDWKTSPWPETRTLPFELVLDRDRARRLLLGVVPREMEDKWFVHRDGAHLLFHRSWTGYLVFRLNVDELGDGRVLFGDPLVNDNSDQYMGDDEDAIDTLTGVIDWLSRRGLP
jgi:hypothetical protein